MSLTAAPRCRAPSTPKPPLPSAPADTPAVAWKPRAQDHPLVAWALENGVIVGLARLRIAMGEAPYCFDKHAMPKVSRV